MRPAAVGLLPYTIPPPALSDRHLFAGRAGRHGVSSGGAAGGHDAAVPTYGGIRRRAGKRRRTALPRHGAGCTAAPPAASCRHRHAASGAMGERPTLAVFRPGVAQPLSGRAGCAEPPRHGNFPLPRPHAAALHAGQGVHQPLGGLRAVPVSALCELRLEARHPPRVRVRPGGCGRFLPCRDGGVRCPCAERAGFSGFTGRKNPRADGYGAAAADDRVGRWSAE